MSFHKDALRTISQAALKTTYLTQIGVGSLGNAILFSRSISPVLLGHKKRPAHTILTHVALSNLLFLLSSGVPHTMAAFLLRKPLSGLGCKFVYYIQRVARGTALCSTRVLSTYQAFTLSPRRAGWVMLRGRAPGVTGPPCCTCWVLSLLMPIPDPLKTTGPRDAHSSTVPRAAGSAQPQVLSQALSTCGPSLMPCFLPSWSGPVAPWCFSCSDTTRECSIFTPTLGTTDAPRRPEPPAPS